MTNQDINRAFRLCLYWRKNDHQQNFIIPEKMQAIEISEFGGPEKLKECIRPTPKL